MGPELCILVYLIPPIFLSDGEAGREHIGIQYRWTTKRAAPILIPLLVGLGIAGSTAIRTAALVTSKMNFKTLAHSINRHLGLLESTVQQLESALDSLAVVLQNR